MTSKIYRGYKTYRFITKSNGMSQKTSAKKDIKRKQRKCYLWSGSFRKVRKALFIPCSFNEI
jgi:hypothetical protein